VRKEGGEGIKEDHRGVRVEEDRRGEGEQKKRRERNRGRKGGKGERYRGKGKEPDRGGSVHSREGTANRKGVPVHNVNREMKTDRCKQNKGCFGFHGRGRGTDGKKGEREKQGPDSLLDSKKRWKLGVLMQPGGARAGGWEGRKGYREKKGQGNELESSLGKRRKMVRP